MVLQRLKSLFSRRSRNSTDTASRGAKSGPKIHRAPRVIHRPIPVEDLDPDAVKIVQRLTRFDHSAFLVGGCVRDLLLDVKPKDFDIGTSATPRQMRRLFRNCRIIGRRFRLAHIYFQNGKIIEVATFRAQDIGGAEAAPDGELLIRDDNLFGTPEEDALRRDFTINSLFYDVNQETVLDHADGLGDLRRRVVRTIGDPAVRFREDPIRILRAIKFAARLDFRIESKTMKALRATRDELPKAAAPRILEELHRFCREGAARRSFEALRDTGVLEVVLPELAPTYVGSGDSWEFLLSLLDGCDRKIERGETVDGGEVLAVLLVPAMLEPLGWSRDGSPRVVRDQELREILDDMLQPFAQRLRLARRDQERCRQILSTLVRMVPARSSRRGSQRAVARRACFPDALAIVDVAANQFGGPFVEAATSWKKAAEIHRDADADARESRPSEESRAPKSGSRRRRGGRGRSRRGRSADGEAGAQDQPAKAEGAVAATAPAERSKPADAKSGGARPAASKSAKRAAATSGQDGSRGKKGDSPEAWDDNYFFSALPTAPSTYGGDDPGGDRYGASAVGGGDPEVAGDSESVEKDAGSAKESPDEVTPRPKRRRRPRRRKRPAKSGSEAGEAASSSPDAPGDSEPEPATDR